MKNMIKVLMILLFGTVLTGTAFAQVDGDGYVGVYDKYLWRGFDLSGSMPVAQAGVDIGAEGVTLSVWGNMQLRSDHSQGYDSGELTETDITLDYTRKFAHGISVGIGNIFYVLDGMEDTGEVYISIAADTLLQPSFTVYYDWDEAEEDGLFYTIALGHEFAVNDAVAINLGTLVSYNQSSDYAVGDYNGLHNCEVNIGATYTINSHLDVAVSLMFSQGLSSAAREVLDAETVSGVTLSYAF